MIMWCPRLAGRSGPAYLAIADAIGEAAGSGELAPGDRLPPQRELAYRLGLSLNTVTRAYTEAVRRGILAGEVGRGTFVRDRSVVPGFAEGASPADALARRTDGPVDFAHNLPFRGAASAALARTLADLSRADSLGAFLDHRPETTRDRHGDAAARWIAALGLPSADRCVVTTNGAQQGLFVALLALTRPGDALMVERLTYAPLLPIARRLGLTVLPVELDAEGIDPGALEGLCRTSAARVLCCTPTLQTPTAATMSDGRRREVAALAERFGLTIVEDDVFGFLPRDRAAPLAAYAPDRTVYVTSVSKSLAAGLRVGYLHAPLRLEGALRTAVALSSWMPPPLMAEIATRWIEDGTADRLAAEQRAEAERRQAMARTMLAGFAVSADPSGFHLWLSLSEAWSADRFEVAARRSGVELRAGLSFAVDMRDRPAAVRLCLSHEVARDRVAAGLERVARLLHQGPDEAAFMV